MQLRRYFEESIKKPLPVDVSTRAPAFPGPGRRARSSPRCGCGIPRAKGSAACRFRVGSREGEAVLSFPFESGQREPAAALGCASAVSPWDIRLSATGNSSPFACRTEGIRALFVVRRDGRAAEGARLESVYTVHPVSWVRIPLPPPTAFSQLFETARNFREHRRRTVPRRRPRSMRNSTCGAGRRRSTVTEILRRRGRISAPGVRAQIGVRRADTARNVGEIQGPGSGSHAHIDGSAGERFQMSTVDRRLSLGVQGYMPQTSTFGFGLRRKIFSSQLFFSSRSKITRWPASAAQPSM